MKLRVLFSRFTIVLLLAGIVGLTACNKSSDSTDQFVPVASTNAIIINPTSTGATFSGLINNFITNTVTSYGVCYSSTNKTPTTADSKSSLTTANVVFFNATVTGLTPATLYYVRSYAVTISNGTIYGNVVQFTTSSATASTLGAVSTFAGSSTPGYTDNTGASARFNSPQGIVADASGNLYVADSFNNLIRKITPAGVVTTFAGNTTPGFTDGTGTAASFYSPVGLGIDASGNLYVADQGNNAIRKITPAGVVTTLAGKGIAGYADYSTGTQALFNNPVGLAVDASGNIYVADKGNNIIRKITPAGAVSTLAGQRAAGYTDAAGTAAMFRSPSAVAVDGKGNLYVADLANNAIRKVIIADGTVSTFLGNPTTDDSLLLLPAGIALDKNGNYFITDESGRVFEITSTNMMYSLAGAANTNNFTNGTGTSATFNSPQGITTNAAGDVFIADNNNNAIRKLVVTVTP